MHSAFRILSFAFAATFAANGFAQGNTGAAPGKTAQPQQPAAGPAVGPSAPAKTEQGAAAPMTAEEQITQLKERLKTRERELRAIRGLKQRGGLIDAVTKRIKKPTKMAPKSIKVELPPALRKMQEQMQAAKAYEEQRKRMLPIPVTLMDPDFAGASQGEVLMLVKNQPVRRTDVDRMLKFIKEHELTRRSAVLADQAVLECVRVAHARGIFANTAQQAKLRCANLYDKLMDGDDFEAVAREHSRGEEAEKGGMVGWIRPIGPRSLTFREQAFRLQKGSVSRVFATTEGYEIIQCVDRKVDEDGMPRVQVRRILMPFQDNLAQVRDEQRYVTVGAAQVQVRDVEVFKMLPGQFKAGPDLMRLMAGQAEQPASAPSGSGGSGGK